MAVDQIILGAVNVQKQIPGIKAAFQDAPSSLNQLPCFVTYPDSGQLDWPRTSGRRKIEHDACMDLYVQKGGDLASADRILKPYIDKVIEAFDQNLSLGGACVNSGVVSYKYGMLNYAGVEYLGIKFILKAVEMQQVIYKP